MRADGRRLMMVFQTEDVFRDGKFGCSLQVLGPPGDETTAGKQGPRGAGPDDDEWNKPIRARWNRCPNTRLLKGPASIFDAYTLALLIEPNPTPRRQV
jgi:hypothetical protein